MARREKARIVEAQIPEILERFRRSGESLKEIAATLGVSPQTVSNTLHAQGISTRRGVGKLSEEDRKDLAQRYRDGARIIDLAHHHHIHARAVREALLADGIEIRAGDWRFGAHQRAEMVRRYEAGDYLADIAKDFRCSEWVIKDAVQRQNMPRRSPGGQYRRFTEAEQKAIVAMRAQGMSQHSIGVVLGASQTTVGRAIRTLGLERPNPLDRRRQWKGGISISPEGYCSVLVPADSPLASMRRNEGYVMEHRLVMAQHLGRPLERWESVHHIDGDRSHNDIANLQLRIGKHGNGQAYICLDCGSHNIAPAPLKE